MSLDAQAQIEHLVVDLTKDLGDQMGPEKVRDGSNRPGSLGIASGSVRRGGAWVPSTGTLSQGRSTLEVRWIREGALTRPVVEWFGPFSGQIESREDVYLLTPEIPSAVYKIRGAAQLDLKIWQRSSGVLDVPGRACGALGSWKKWSFPLPSPDRLHGESQSWVAVRKVRRIRSFALPPDASLEPGGSAGSGTASCAVELTAVSVGNEHWWTLCFEAEGNDLEAPKAIDVATRSVFREPLPDGSELGPADAMSYLQWLHRRVASRDVRVSSRQKQSEGGSGPRLRSPRDAMSQTDRATAASTRSPAAQLDQLPEPRMSEA